MTRRIPITVVSGYLGAGKTTFVNSLLTNAGGTRFAVLVNDFGDLPIDADLIVAQEGNLISVAGGCICCSFGDDLSGALFDLIQSDVPVDHFLIEASGVALPLPLIQTLTLLPGVAIDGVVTLVDVESVQRSARNRYIGDTVLKQLAASDLVVLNKVDLVTPEKVAEVQRWLTTTAPNVRIIPTRHAAVPPEVVLGSGMGESYDAADFSPWSCHEVDNYLKLKFVTSRRCDVSGLVEILTAGDIEVLRAKGFLRDLAGEMKLVQIVGRRAVVEPASASVALDSRLVIISLMSDAGQQGLLEEALEGQFHPDVELKNS